jgi:hypothetical protein
MEAANAYKRDIVKLEKRLQQLAQKGTAKTARAALSGAMGPAKKAIRKTVNNSRATPELRRAARQTISSTVKRAAKGSTTAPYVAKVGFGVGKPSKKKRTQAHERSVYGQRGAAIVAGVGLSSRNVHWFVLGTAKRTQKTTGREVGAIEPELKGVVPISVARARPLMVKEAGRKAEIALKKEAKKRR